MQGCVLLSALYDPCPCPTVRPLPLPYGTTLALPDSAPRRRAARVAYGTSKLCNVLFARELSRRVAGKRVAVAALHPGIIPSECRRRGSMIVRFSAVRAIALPARADSTRATH